MIPKIYKTINSPLSAFNNITNEISSEISNIFFRGLNKDYMTKTGGNILAVESQIIFLDESIYILGIFKLTYNDKANEKVTIKILNPNLKPQDLKYLNILYENFGKITTLFFRYIQMYNIIAKNCDDIPSSLIIEIVNNISNKKFGDYHLLPFKNKISKLQQNLLSNKLDKYEFFVQFSHHTRNKFKFNIWQCLSSDLDQNVSINNIRFLEKELLTSGYVDYIDAETFVKQLFHYGNLINKN